MISHALFAAVTMGVYRERQPETARQTARQTDRQTDRQTESSVHVPVLDGLRANLHPPCCALMFPRRVNTLLSLRKLALCCASDDQGMEDEQIAEIDQDLMLIQYQKQLPDGKNLKILEKEELVARLSEYLTADNSQALAHVRRFRAALEVLFYHFDGEDQMELLKESMAKIISYEQHKWSTMDGDEPNDKIQGTLLFKTIRTFAVSVAEDDTDSAARFVLLGETNAAATALNLASSLPLQRINRDNVQLDRHIGICLELSAQPLYSF